MCREVLAHYVQDFTYFTSLSAVGWWLRDVDYNAYLNEEILKLTGLVSLSLWSWAERRAEARWLLSGLFLPWMWVSVDVGSHNIPFMKRHCGLSGTAINMCSVLCVLVGPLGPTVSGRCSVQVCWVNKWMKHVNVMFSMFPLSLRKLEWAALPGASRWLSLAC